MKKMKDENDKITFSKEIDDIISSYALGISLVILGFVLQFFPGVFGSVDRVISILFIIIGLIGLYAEFDKEAKKHDIKGLNDIIIAIIFGLILIVIKLFIKVPNGLPYDCLKVIYIFFVMVDIYGFILGILKTFYSIYLLYCHLPKKKKFFSYILKTLIEIAGFILVIFQIIQIANSF